MSHDTTRPAEAPAAPVPHERMRELDFFLGTWQAHGVFREAPGAPGKPIEMHIEGSSQDRGFWITRRTAERPTQENPVPITGLAVWGYDMVSGEFAADWYDSNGARAIQRSKGWDGDRIEFTGPVTMNGVTVTLRDTFTRRGPDAYHHIGEVDWDGSWFAADEEDVVRVT
jgi:hypothetical protein